MIILHASDLHFGKPHLPAVAEAVLDLAEEQDADVVVVSGDITQRAKAGEYRAAQRFLARLSPRPLVVTAGNHDVPLYRVWERIFAPYRQYRTHIADRLDTVLDVGRAPRAEHPPAPGRAGAPSAAEKAPGARFVALNSSAPRSAIVNGRLAASQLEFAAKAFAVVRPPDLRVLVVHHNLVGPRDGEVPLLPRARRVLCAVGEWGVDLVLSGHIHRSHLGVGRCEAGDGAEGSEEPGGFDAAGGSAGASGVPVVTAGTSSSSRGRKPEAGRNSVNVVRVHKTSLDVAVHMYSAESGSFEPAKRRRYVRRGG